MTHLVREERMANKRAITLHFATVAAKRATLDALQRAHGIELQCIEGELLDAEWADVSLPRQRNSLTHCTSGDGSCAGYTGWAGVTGTLSQTADRGREERSRVMLCNQVLDSELTVDGTVDPECGQPATHFLFGHRDAPICGDCIDSYRASGEWSEAELGLVPIQK